MAVLIKFKHCKKTQFCQTFAVVCSFFGDLEPPLNQLRLTWNFTCDNISPKGNFLGVRLNFFKTLFFLGHPTAYANPGWRPKTPGFNPYIQCTKHRWSFANWFRHVVVLNVTNESQFTTHHTNANIRFGADPLPTCASVRFRRPPPGVRILWMLTYYQMPYQIFY